MRVAVALTKARLAPVAAEEVREPACAELAAAPGRAHAETAVATPALRAAVTAVRRTVEARLVGLAHAVAALRNGGGRRARVVIALAKSRLAPVSAEQVAEAARTELAAAARRANPVAPVAEATLSVTVPAVLRAVVARFRSITQAVATPHLP